LAALTWPLRKVGAGRLLGLALLPALLFIRIVDPNPVEELRLRTFDFYQVLRPREPTLRPAVIVDIDEASLQSLGQWPWPRTLIADLVKRLTELGALVIGFDVIFAEPDRYSPASIIKLVPDLDEQTREHIAELPGNDAVFAAALRAGKVVLGQSGITQPKSSKVPLREVSVANLGGDPARYLIAFPGVLRNIPVLEEAAAGVGMLTIRPDRDGIVRRVPLAMRAGGVTIPSLGMEMLHLVADPAGPIVIQTDPAGIESIGAGEIELSTDRNGQVWVYFGPSDSTRYVSAQDVLAGRVSREQIERKLVLIGTSAIGLLDRQTTPLDPSMPGVEVHAQILETVLSGSEISYPDYAMPAELLATLTVSLGVIVFAPALGALAVVFLGAGLAAVLAGGSWYFFTQQSLLIDFTYPLISSLAVFLVLVFTNYFREQAQRQQIRSAFGQYLAPELVEELARSPEKLVLGGEERQMTFLFSDVRDFTTISETYKHDPQQLTSLINRLLTPLTSAIIRHSGTIDKYMGDAVMAFWNAPLDDKQHSANACRAALEMVECMKTLNAQLESEAKARGEPLIPIRIGIGVNSGPCVVGNMGSQLRFNYSVLGDSVNLASRLEGQTKNYGVSIVAGTSTMATAGDEFAFLELDFIRVKGKRDPEIVYGIFGGREIAGAERFRRLGEVNHRLLSCYRGREWAKAMEAIVAAQSLAAEFGLTHFFRLYEARIRQLQDKPPPDDWDGAFTAEGK
jgi:adenylate cyclase